MTNHSWYLQQMGIDVWTERKNIDISYPVAEQQQNSSNNNFHSFDWPDLKKCVSDCVACPLHQTRTQTVFGIGSQQADLLIIGEAPGANEDLQGEPFVGRAGKLLDNMLVSIGLNRQKIYIANILKCRPPNNRDPNPEEVSTCTPFLQRQIELLQPKLILAVGRIAAHYLLNSNVSLGKLRGILHQYQNIPLIISYHPAYLLRSPREKAKALDDLLWVKNRLRDI